MVILSMTIAIGKRCPVPLSSTAEAQMASCLRQCANKDIYSQHT